MELLATFLSQQPFLALFLVIALGYGLGSINIRRFSLGASAVVFSYSTEQEAKTMTNSARFRIAVLSFLCAVGTVAFAQDDSTLADGKVHFQLMPYLIAPG